MSILFIPEKAATNGMESVRTVRITAEVTTVNGVQTGTLGMLSKRKTALVGSYSSIAD